MNSPEPGRRRPRADPIEGVLADEAAWKRVRLLASAVDRRLAAADARLTMGGEPTFVSATDRQSPFWWFTPLGDDKLTHAWRLAEALTRRWAPGGILILTRGKSYPGETEPRWNLACVWQRDGTPLWRARRRLALPASPGDKTLADAERFLRALAVRLELPPSRIHAVFHPPADSLPHDSSDSSPQETPENTPAAGAQPLPPERLDSHVSRPSWETGRWAPAGFVLPLTAGSDGDGGRWFLRDGPLTPTPGSAPLGFRLPEEHLMELGQGDSRALCVEIRDGHLHVFVPALPELEGYVSLLAAIEATATALDTAVVLTGHAPAGEPMIGRFDVAPDPGVLEVNLPPAADWEEWESRVTELYEAAFEAGLDTRRFLLNGRMVGTGGGSHILLGGATPDDSPFHRRPEVLASMLAYWHNHPSLSYAFSDACVGPFSQHARVDESRDGALEELEIALAELAAGRVEPHAALRHILVDRTGNPHRMELCIDKLALPSKASALGGLVELRAFEMQPTARMSLLVHLLVRALFAGMWERPYRARLKRWGARLHDAYMLPAVLWSDFCTVLEDLAGAGFDFDPAWFEPLWECRFPEAGRIEAGGTTLELRHALEPWVALGETGATRLLDSSIERLQVRLGGSRAERCAVACNRYALPLHRLGYARLGPRGTVAEAAHGVGVRFRAWVPYNGMHPGIPPHAPLTFELFAHREVRSLARCVYHSVTPDGGDYPGYPADAAEAERRCRARFHSGPSGETRHRRGATRGSAALRRLPASSEQPLTADLRRGGLKLWTIEERSGPAVVYANATRTEGPIPWPRRRHAPGGSERDRAGIPVRGERLANMDRTAAPRSGVLGNDDEPEDRETL